MPDPAVSDHALLRFLERVYHVDVAELRSRMLTPKVVAAIKAGASAVTIEGVKYIVSEGVIVTVLGEDQQRHWRRKRVKTRSKHRHGRDPAQDDTRERMQEEN